MPPGDDFWHVLNKMATVTAGLMMQYIGGAAGDRIHLITNAVTNRVAHPLEAGLGDRCWGLVSSYKCFSAVQDVGMSPINDIAVGGTGE